MFKKALKKLFVVTALVSMLGMYMPAYASGDDLLLLVAKSATGIRSNDTVKITALATTKDGEYPDKIVIDFNEQVETCENVHYCGKDFGPFNVSVSRWVTFRVMVYKGNKVVSQVDKIYVEKVAQLDNEKPRVVRVTTNGNIKKVGDTFNATGYATDNVGVKYMEAYLDGTKLNTCNLDECGISVELKNSGDSKYEFIAYDEAGNKSNAFWGIVRVAENDQPQPDTQKPRVSRITTNGNIKKVGDTFNATGYATDNKGVKYVEAYFNNEKVNTCNASECSFSKELKDEGTFKYEFIAYDEAGNKGSLFGNVRVVEITQPQPDTQKPAIRSLNYSQKLFTGETQNINVKATDNVGVVKIEVSVGGTVLDTCKNQSSCDFKIGPYDTAGFRAFVVAVYDVAGNKATAEYKFEVVTPEPPQPQADTEKPTVSVTGELGLYKNYILNSTASDNKAVTKIKLYFAEVDDEFKEVDTCSGANLKSCYFKSNDNVLVAGKRYAYKAVAYDAAGNMNQTRIDYLTVPVTPQPPQPQADTEKPTVYIEAALDKDNNYTLNSTASDNKGVVKIDLYFSEANESVNKVRTCSGANLKNCDYKSTNTLTAGKRYAYWAKAYDAAGNMNQTRTSYLTVPVTPQPEVDTQKPGIDIKAYLVENNNYTLNSTASDNKAVVKIDLYFSEANESVNKVRTCSGANLKNCDYKSTNTLTAGKSYAYWAKAYDAAGNMNQTRTSYLTVPVTPQPPQPSDDEALAPRLVSIQASLGTEENDFFNYTLRLAARANKDRNELVRFEIYSGKANESFELLSTIDIPEGQAYYFHAASTDGLSDPRLELLDSNSHYAFYTIVYNEAGKSLKSRTVYLITP